MKDILHPSAAKGYPTIADALVGDLIGGYAVPAKASSQTPVVGASGDVCDMVGRADSATSPGVTSSGHPYNVTVGAFGVSAHQIYNPNGALARMLLTPGFVDGEFGVALPVVATSATLFFRWINV